MTQDRKTTVDVDLVWPIAVEGGAELKRLTFRRPKGRTIKRLLALLGPELINDLVGEGAEPNAAEAGFKDKTRDLLLKAATRIMSGEGLDEISALIGELCGQSAEIVDEVDPEDYPAIGKALAGFFPSLFSAGAGLPPT